MKNFSLVFNDMFSLKEVFNLSENTLIEPEEIKHDPALKTAMEMFDLKLIPSSHSEKGLIGAGAFGEVFEVLYKGKRAALKLSLDGEGDAQAYNDLLKIQEKIPNFVRRSLPNIYVQKSFDIEDYGKTYATLMEFLNPPSRSVLKAGWLTRPHKNPDVHYSARQAYEKFMNEYFVNIINQHLNKKEADKILNSPEMKAFLKDQYTKITDPDSDIEDIELGDLYDIFKKYVGQDFATEITDMIDERWKENRPKITKFPEGSYDDDEIPKNFEDPRIKHLYLSLRWLYKNGFLESWGDVHEENVLMRSNGDLVVADIGMFEF